MMQFECYHYTTADHTYRARNEVPYPLRGSEEMMCVRHKDNVHTAGDTTRAPGCGSCWCCTIATTCDCKETLTEIYWKPIDIVYDTDQGTVDAMAPDVVQVQKINNEQGSTEQTTEFEVSEEVQESIRFQHTTGANIMVGASFTVGIPSVVSGTVSTELSVSYDFQTETEKSTTKTIAARFQCNAPAYRTTQCSALLFKYRTTVPYVQTWNHK